MYTSVHFYKRRNIFICVCVCLIIKNIELWEIISDSKNCNGDGKEQIMLFANLG